MVVGREHLSDPTLVHNAEARTIYQTPPFILSVCEQLPCLGIKRNIDMHNFNIW